MATVSAVFGEFLSIPEPSARFLLALFSAYPIAFAYRIIAAERSSYIKNLFFTLSGLMVMYYVYGVIVWHLIVDVLAVYLVLRVYGESLSSVYITWLITMGHLLGGYLSTVYMKQVHPISWTIPHCVLVLKLIGLSYNIHDGGKKNSDNLSEDIKKLAVKRIPSFLEITGFCFYFGSGLVGPQIPFSRHLEFTEGRLFDWQRAPGSILAGLQRLLLGILISILFSILNQYFPITSLVTDEFTERSFLTKILLVFVCGKVALWRYICVWLIAEGSCIITGISYGGVDKDGRINWHALANIDIIKFETTITLEGVINSFNLNTNKWVALYVFKRLKFLGNKQLSWAIAMLFVSVWHGLWPGYYLNFSLEIFMVLAERTFISFLRNLVGRSLTDMSLSLRLPFTLMAYMLKNCLLMYPLTMFMLLTWTDCYKFMKSVYFYGHVVTIAWLLLYYTLLVRVKRRRVKDS